MLEPVPARELAVHADDGLIGFLSEQNNLWRFSYANSWLNSPYAFSLAPSLPVAESEHIDGASLRPVQWFFDNLLPEAQARSYWAGKAGVDQNDAFAMLAYYGAESVGALTLLQAGQQQTSPSLQSLSKQHLLQRIQALPVQAEGDAAPKRMSVAGAQYKFAVVLQGDSLYDPVGSWPSTHLIKPDSKDESYPHSAINEWFVMRLAKLCGLDVAPVRFVADPAPYLIVERFDRSAHHEASPAKRQHLLDACQLLSIDHTAKYRAATPAALQQIIGLCATKLATRRKLFEWLLFNAAVGNDDNHLKNLSFFSGKTGYLYAPTYDLLSTAVYRILPPDQLIAQDWRQAALVFQIGDAKTFAELTRKNVVEMGVVLGLPMAWIEKRLNELLLQIVNQSAHLLETIELERTADGAAIGTGELRLLRQIHYVVIKQIALQLAA